MAKRCATTHEFAAVFAWEFQGNGKIEAPKLHREPLHFETVELAQRSYK